MFMMNAMDRAERERQELRGIDRGSVAPQGPAPCQKGGSQHSLPILSPFFWKGAPEL